MDIQVRHCLNDLDCGGYLLLVCFRVLFHINYQKLIKKEMQKNTGNEQREDRKKNEKLIMHLRM